MDKATDSQNSVKRSRKKKKPYGRVIEYEEVLKYGSEYYELHKLWRQYNYDSLIAQSTISHRTGYIPEDTYGLCVRTIKKCKKELGSIESEIDKIELREEIYNED